MGRGNFTENEIDALRRNPYVVDVNQTSISYSKEFKFLFIKEYMEGRNPVDIFRGAGFDITVLGSKRIERACARWKESYRSGTLGSRSAVLSKDLEENVNILSAQERRESDTKNLMEQCRRQEKTIQYLRAEVELLQKTCSLATRGDMKVIPRKELCRMIDEVTEQEEYRQCVTHLCEMTGVSRSLYYLNKRKREREEK